MTPEALDLIKAVGLPIALLLLALIAGARGTWYYGNTYRSLERDRDYWREMALRGTDLAERAVDAQSDRRAGGQRRGD
jgi:hypothetical protein